MVTAEANQYGVCPESFSSQLADVQLTLFGQLRASRVPDVRVVRPDDELGGAGAALQVREQRFERVGHVAIAQVPAVN